MASGDVLCVWTAQASIPSAANYATQDTRNVHPVLDYDATTAETAYFEDAIPANYAGGGLTIDVYWMATSATTGDVVFSGAVERMMSGGTDQDADSFAAEANSTAVTTNATSGILNKSTITHASGAAMDSVAAGEPFRYQLQREPADAGDTMTGDAEVSRVVVKET
jgi:hypothetical protein